MNANKAILFLSIIFFANLSLCSKNNLFTDEFYVKMAKLFERHKEYSRAVGLYKKALQKNEYNAEANYQLGLHYYDVEDHGKTLACFYKLLSMQPNNHDNYVYIGRALFKKGDYRAAVEVLQRGLQLFPKSSTLNITLSNVYYILGDIEQGCKFRDLFYNFSEKQKRKKIKNQWHGSDVNGKTVLIHNDVGMGDMFQWVRYGLLFKNQGAAKVIAAVRKSMIPIISLCPYLDSVVDRGKELPEFDVQVYIDRLPYVASRTMESIGETCFIPYLHADQTLVKKWKKILEPDTNFKIGICWESASYIRAKTKTLVKNDRSIPLYYFYHLGKLKGVSLYSLQQVNGTWQAKVMPKDFKIYTFDKNFDKGHGGFMDTAAVMKNLDLVISVDTSVCHLAGGLGVPVWLLLPCYPSGRWFLDRDDTPWYPTMRLFRQQTKGDWESMMMNVLSELKILLECR